jgi:aryl-alcohol dehydrogenase-like predicted oxidoreductase
LLKDIGLRKYYPGFTAGGLRKSSQVVRLVKDLAVKYSVTPSQVALNWLIHYRGDTVVAIPGATREDQAKENTGAMTFRLSDEDMQKLDRESQVFK